MAGEKILIIEDEKDLVKILKYNLEKEGFRVVAALDGEAALALFKKEKPNLIVLDIMLPKIDGYEICKLIRQESKVPILMLTAKQEEFDKVLGLELGADDYVTKPFSVKELVARIKAISRRLIQKEDGPTTICVGHLEVNLESYEVHVDGKTVRLSPKEFEFLKCLIQAKGRAIKRDDLMEKVWGVDASLKIDTRTVDQHIARMREKLKSEAGRIVTVQNIGYRFKMD